MSRWFSTRVIEKAIKFYAVIWNVLLFILKISTVRVQKRSRITDLPLLFHLCARKRRKILLQSEQANVCVWIVSKRKECKQKYKNVQVFRACTKQTNFPMDERKNKYCERIFTVCFIPWKYFISKLRLCICQIVILFLYIILYLWIHIKT